MQRLLLRGCTTVTNGGLLGLVKRCKQLIYLDVSGCPMVTTVTAMHSSGSSWQSSLHLQHLDLSDCPAVDDTSMKIVTASCPHLTVLHLRRCSNISDMSLHY